MSERWLTFREAVEIVRVHLGVGIGRAEARTNAARASGEVRFQNPADPVLLMADDGLVGMDMRPGAQDKAGVTADGKLIKHRIISTSAFQISKDDLLDWLGRQQSPDQKPDSKPAAHPGGRPPEYELVEIKLFFQQLLQDRGDPTNEKDQSPGWKSIADAMKVISDHMEKQGRDVPGNTRFREVLNAVLSDHRRASAN
jgi:hypothetical protein